MNNYLNFKNYNYADMYNNPYTNVFENITNKENSNTLYDPYNGFIRGNLFKNLYDPYINEEPYEIKPINDQAKLLTDIDSLGFAMIDLNLLLDVNPNDEEAINLYNQYKEQKKSLTKNYESMFGPITLNSDSLNSYPWAWIDMPWPWDN